MSEVEIADFDQWIVTLHCCLLNWRSLWMIEDRGIVAVGCRGVKQKLADTIAN
jgi:hypothetical protein